MSDAGVGRRGALRAAWRSGLRLVVALSGARVLAPAVLLRAVFEPTAAAARGLQAAPGAEPPAGSAREPGPEPFRFDGERRAVDPYRLPKHVLPARYELILEPDLEHFTFAGAVTITLVVQTPTSELLLNAAELEIPAAQVSNEAGITMTGKVRLEPELERCRVELPRTLSPGTWRLQLRFTGRLNDKLRGFYRSTYKDGSGATRVLAATQFEATDARRAFPCWDEPAFKAVFATTLLIDPALMALSNTAIARERVEGGKKIVTFHDTIKMSTYLVAFVVGQLEASDAVMVGRTALRVWSVPGKGRLAGFAQEIGAFSLRFFEGYYGLPYPGDKLDLIAIPDFASGAMENLGAITFRETALLIDPKVATHAELERVADVVAHENAHMWFGDLVTMSWWNGLWLNEAFATFMEMLAVDAWKPEWRRWTSFGVSRAAAMAVDALHSTRPIEYPVQAPSDADAMFDVLTYEKGASVLRMLEQYLGSAAFRDGVRDYLRSHAYANADTGDLWAAIGHVAKQPVPELMNAWIFKPGYPILSATLDGTALHLRQTRFTYLPASLVDPAAAGTALPESHWHVPVQLRLLTETGPRVERVLLKDAELRVELPANVQAVVINESGHGFYRVRYSAELLERLLRLVPDKLAPIERFNLVNDAWATAVAGLMPMTDYLELTARFKGERDRNVWAVLIDSFAALNRIINPGDRPALERLVRDRLQAAVEDLGWAPRPGDDELTKQLRAELIRTLGTIGNDPAVQSRAAGLFEQSQAASGAAGEGVDPNLVPALIAILAYTGGETRYTEFLKRYRSAATPQEERRYLYALTGFQPPELVDQTLARTINGEFRTQDAPFIILALLMTVHGREQAWRFVKANWDVMDRQFPKNGLRRMCQGVAALATRELERDVRQFFTERRIDLGGKTLAQYLEQLRVAVVVREREAERVGKYLQKT